MNRNIAGFLLMLVAMTVFTSALAQELPRTVAIQGILRDQQNNALGDGIYTMTFSIYTNQTGGSVLWSSPSQSINVQNGEFSAKLSDFGASVDFSNQYYVGVLIEGMSAELPNRIILSAAPYAMALIGQENILTGSGNVGLGTTEPDEKLTVDGNMKITGSLELGTGLLVNSSLTLGGTGTGIYNESYRPVLLSSDDPMLGSRLQFFTGSDVTGRYIEINSGRGFELSLNTSLIVKNSQWGSGIKFNSTISDALPSDYYYISRGGSNTTKDDLVFHIDSSAGSTFAILSQDGATRFSADGSTGNVAIGKLVDTSARLDVDGSISIDGNKPFDFKEYVISNHIDPLETGYESSKWTASIVGRRSTNMNFYHGDAQWDQYCYEKNGLIKIRLILPIDANGATTRLYVLFVRKELIANPNTPGP